MRVARVRSKACDRCETKQDVLYRVRVERLGPWIFVCTSCLEKVRPGNPDYQYGGTWKSRKRH